MMLAKTCTIFGHIVCKMVLDVEEVVSNMN